MILVLLPGKLEGKLFAVERYDHGDAFVHWSDDKSCTQYGGYPVNLIHPNPDCNTTLGCCCSHGTTFYTLSGNCERLQDENSTVKGTLLMFLHYSYIIAISIVLKSCSWP